MYIFSRGEKVRAFIFCNPNNPLGVVYPKSLGKYGKRRNFICSIRIIYDFIPFGYELI
jgi:aspartate/methionine/tyrosine aminotransferase